MKKRPAGCDCDWAAGVCCDRCACLSEEDENRILAGETAERTFEEMAAEFLDGLRALTERTGIVVSAEAMDGENAQVTLAIRPKGAGWYRYVDGGVAWRSAADHEAEKEQYRAQIRAMELAIPNKARVMFAAEGAALRDTRKRLAALESEGAK